MQSSLKTIKGFLKQKKSKIGWFHGLTACIGAMLLAYLTAMVITHFIEGNNSLRIVPIATVTPILMAIYGTWLLFSQTRLDVLKKILFLSLFLSCLILLFIKIF